MKATRALVMPHGASTHLRWVPRLGRALLGGSLVGSATLAMAFSGGSVGAALKHQSATKLIRAAYSQTVAAKTAKVTLTESITQSNSLPLQVTISGQGSLDFSSSDMTLTFSSPQTPGNYSVLFVSPNLYIQLPAADKAQLPAGKTWLSLNLNTVTEAKLGASLSQLSSSSQESTQLLSYLQAVSTSGITTVGPATIKGVATTEYKATVDLTKVADQKSPAAQAAIKSLEAQVNATTVPVQVWLDGQGRVRQVSEQIQVSTTSQSSGGTTIPAASGSVSTTVDYYDFGTPVTVQAPPSSQVDDVTSQALAAASTTTTAGG
jgi:hypothetical protein